jgi:hypothetical protein
VIRDWRSAVVVLACGPLACAASAHPIVSTDINRHVIITVQPREIEVDYLYEMLEIAAVAAAREADVDRDGQTSEEEREAQFQRWIEEVSAQLQLELDGVPLPLNLRQAQRSQQGSVFGLPTARWNLRLSSPLPARGAQGSLVFRDRYRQDQVGWKEIVVQAGDGVVVRGAGASARDRSRRLTDYAAISELPNPDEQGLTVMLGETAMPASSPEPAPGPSAGRAPEPRRQPPPAPAREVRTAAPADAEPELAAQSSAPVATPPARALGARLRQDAWPFFRLGVHHIATGYDHLLFLLGLLLFRQSLARVVAVVTAFTVAHSLTLALAALGWITPPGRAIEILIAFTIAYVGAVTLVRPESRHGPGLAFGFGLVHGFGFAGALQEAIGARMGTGWLLSLAGFNLGIEAFQLLAVCLVYPLLRLTERPGWSLRVRSLLSVGVLSAGLAWLVARAL